MNLGGFPPWLDQQVGLYSSSGSSPGPGTLVPIMIGGNDVANNLGDLEALEAGIGSIVSQITNLVELGADQFVVANVPDIGATPLFQAGSPAVAQFATFWTTQWNAALAAALDGLSASLPEVVISELDLFSLGKDPELLALFTNTTDACLAPPSICSDPASYFYWDSFHPSSTAHALIAEAAHATYVTTLLDRLLVPTSSLPMPIPSWTPSAAIDPTTQRFSQITRVDR